LYKGLQFTLKHLCHSFNRINVVTPTQSVKYSTYVPLRSIAVPGCYKRQSSNEIRDMSRRFVGFRQHLTACLLIAEQGT